ncbi:MAG TPA: TfoX/Sxy family protein [Polyangiaceae bacterium]
MKWKRPTPETLAHFERIAPGAPLETRSLFGMPCRFLNGHMLVGVFQNSIMLRLSEEDRKLCILAGARPFQPMGREMSGYVELSPDTFDTPTLKQWIARGMRFIGSLPPKLKPGVVRQAGRRSEKTRRTRRSKAAAERPAKKLVAKKASVVPARPAARKKSARKRPAKGLRRGNGSKRRSRVRPPRHRTARTRAARRNRSRVRQREARGRRARGGVPPRAVFG